MRDPGEIYLAAVRALDIVPTVGKEAEQIRAAIRELQAKAQKWDRFEASVRATGTKTSENVYLVPASLTRDAIDDNEPESDWGGDEYCEPANIKSEMAIALEANYRKIYTPDYVQAIAASLGELEKLCGINSVVRGDPAPVAPAAKSFARLYEERNEAQGSGLSARYSADDLTKPDKYRGEPITCDLSEDWD